MTNRALFHRKLAEKVLEYDSQAAAARGMGLSPAYLSDLLKGKREPSRRVLGLLGLGRVVTLMEMSTGEMPEA